MLPAGRGATSFFPCRSCFPAYPPPPPPRPCPPPPPARPATSARGGGGAPAATRNTETSRAPPGPPPSGLAAHQLRRAMDLPTEAVSGRGRQPTYEELRGSPWRQLHHEPFRASGRSGVCLSPILATLLAVIVGSMSLAGVRKQIVR